MKRLLPLLLAAVLLLSACNVQVKPSDTTAAPAQSGDRTTTAGDSQPAVTAQNGIPITILGFPSYEKDMNIVRDLLTKAGFNVELNMQANYSGYLTQIEAGNYDLALSGWTTVTGNPDYAVRSLFYTGGAYNRSGIADSRIDELIDRAASETSEVYGETYAEFEKVLVEENAYVMPLYNTLKTQAFQKNIVKPGTINLGKSIGLLWPMVEYVDKNYETDPLYLSQTTSSITSLDPIKGNDGSMYTLSYNTYIRIINLTDDDTPVTNASLSHAFMIGEGNTEYYFLLRDDVNFAKVENMQAVDSGVRVGGEDVIFTLERARDKNSVPNHVTYSLHESIQSVEMVTDLSVLDSVKDSNTGDSLRAVLEAAAPAAISGLTDDKTQADNAGGTYQLIKVTTKTPFPQVLNYLAHQSAGVVCKEQVEAVNTYDIANYNPNTDVAYGDQSTFTEGATYNNTIMASGPYIPLYKNDYEIAFERNPGYMPESEYASNVRYVTVKFIKDMDGCLIALRAGEIYVLGGIPGDKVAVIEGDANLEVQQGPSNGVTYLVANLSGELANADLRKAILYCINQDSILAIYQNKAYRAYTTVSPLVDTGNVLTADANKVNEYLNKYLESK